MENFEKCTVAMLGGPCSQHVTGNTSRQNQPQSAIICYHTTRIWAGSKILLFHPPTPGNPRRSCMPPGPAWHWFNTTRPEQGTCTRCEDLRPTWNRGAGICPPPQLMSEPFPRDKVKMTRNMSCGEATSLQHNKNTWLNPNYNPAGRTSANQHDD